MDLIQLTSTHPPSLEDPETDYTWPSSISLHSFPLSITRRHRAFGRLLLLYRSVIWKRTEKRKYKSNIYKIIIQILKIFPLPRHHHQQQSVCGHDKSLSISAQVVSLCLSLGISSHDDKCRYTAHVAVLLDLLEGRRRRRPGSTTPTNAIYILLAFTFRHNYSPRDSPFPRYS